jgi:hypothetical protein
MNRITRGPSGHLEQLPSGRFRVDVYAGTDPLTGRRLRYRQTVNTEVQARRKTLRYLLLGDVTLVLDLGHGIRVLTDSRVHDTARAERQAADELPSGSPEKRRHWCA